MRVGLPYKIASYIVVRRAADGGVIMIFWVINNVSPAFYPLELAPSICTWGYGWSLRQIVWARKSLLFGTKSRTGSKFDVLVVWCVVDSVAFMPTCSILVIH